MADNCPEEKTCGDCIGFLACGDMGLVERGQTTCIFHPSAFKAINPGLEIREITLEVESLDIEREICENCKRPVACKQDWETFEGVEGGHLCWGQADCGFARDSRTVVLAPNEVVVSLPKLENFLQLRLQTVIDALCGDPKYFNGQTREWQTMTRNPPASDRLMDMGKEFLECRTEEDE